MGDANLTISGGSVTFGASGASVGSSSALLSSVTQTGGSLTTPFLNIGVSAAATGVYNLSAGNVSVSSSSACSQSKRSLSEGWM